jgi:hypothetical protein
MKCSQSLPYSGVFVGGADHFKEQFGPELAGGDVAGFIQDQQVP